MKSTSFKLRMEKINLQNEISPKINFCVQREIFSFQTPPLLAALWVTKTPLDFRNIFSTCFVLLILWFAFGGIRCLSYVPPWAARKIEGQREVGDFIGACSSPVFLLGAVAFP